MFWSQMGFLRLPQYPSLGSAAALDAVKVIHYAYPPVLLVYFAGALCATFWFQQKETCLARNVYRRAIMWANLGVLLTYNLLLYYPIHWYNLDGLTLNSQVYSVSSILAWGVLHFCLLESPEPVWYPYWGSWIMGLVGELSVILLSMKSEATAPQRSIFASTGFWLRYLRLVILLSLLILFLVFRKRSIVTETSSTEETAQLLGQPGTNEEYGAIVHIGNSDNEDNRKERELQELAKRIEEGGWLEYAKSFKIFWPHIWPQKDRALQIRIALVGGCLVIERGLNVLTPMQMGRVTNALMAGGLGHVPWMEVFLFILIRWLGSGAGVPALQRYLWLPIDQYAFRCITTAAYNHVMSLSCEFHTSKDTGEVYSAVQQGRAVTGFMNMVLFSVLPMLADLIVAFGYFYITFGIYMALIVTFASCVYVWITSRLNRKRIDLRRNFSKSSRRETHLMWQSMTNWETVAAQYLNRIGYEQDRYSGAIKCLQEAERDSNNAMLMLNVTQNATFTIGLLFASFLAIYQVTMGHRKVGDFVALLSYWAQIADIYGMIQMRMLDAERLLQLMQMAPSVVTKSGAEDLVVTTGEVSFRNVSFGYDPRKGAIKGMNFQAAGGKITALVGMSGGGKSTCLKLLFRFYDVTDGAITIDGQDIREVTLPSLREQIGVVPQEPRMFNETIMDNLRYACLEASDEEIYSACRSAAIHDKILTFPEGYLSKIAIARAILKNPKIVLLDEATSSVDPTTERLIQQGLNKLATGRTMFIVAHRLSTIMHADQILVIEDGNIIENGKHEELLKLRGKYSELWRGNISADNSNTLSKDFDENETIQSQYEVTSSTGAVAVPLPNTEVTREQLMNTAPFKIKCVPLAARKTDLFHPHTYPRTPTSMRASKTTYFKSLAKENIGPIRPNDACAEGAKVLSLQKSAKHDSILKPEAKEFIPASIATLSENHNNANAIRTAIQLAPETQSRVSPLDFQCFLDEHKKQNFSKHDASTNTAEGAASETLEQKHRRRRHRRRSRSSRSSSGNDQQSTATESVIRQSIRTNGYVAVFHPAEQKNNDSCNGQHLQSTRNSSFPNGNAIEQADLPSMHDARDTKAVVLSHANTSTGLNETASNMPFIMKRSFVSHDARGGLAPRWKLHGKPLLSENIANGYGATTPKPGTNPKPTIGFEIQNVPIGSARP
ncbi:hypothetical protein BGX38DRAFT_1143311 [Terfezia claveryi]|nr:hypothetical protein BGX38DRAFT_1143311 [Terfezia claveryi]